MYALQISYPPREGVANGKCETLRDGEDGRTLLSQQNTEQKFGVNVDLHVE